MSILHQLGINYTAFYCFIIFVITFFFLKEFLFRPYFIAFEQRENRTKGGESSAKDLQSQTLQLKQQFEEEARDINAEIKSLFDETRSVAVKESEKMIHESKKEAEQIIEETRGRLSQEVKKAQDQLRLEVPGVALVITKKMLD